MAWRRRRWRALQAGLDPRRLVFIDETWIKTNMVPLRGWAPKGQRLCGFAPQGRWRTLTFLGALRWDGLTAPCIFDGPINGQCFRAYVEQLLLPALRPGDIVVLDNLGSHKAKALRPMLKTAGASDRLPLSVRLGQLRGSAQPGAGGRCGEVRACGSGDCSSCASVGPLAFSGRARPHAPPPGSVSRDSYRRAGPLTIQIWSMAT